MGIVVGGKLGVVADPNIVPLIDILLVLLVIFMVIPNPWGLQAQIPQECWPPGLDNCGRDKPTAVVVQVFANGSLRVNQEPVQWENLDTQLQKIFKVRADRTAFIWGDASVEFGVVARVIDVMHTAGITPVALLTQPLGNDF